MIECSNAIEQFSCYLIWVAWNGLFFHPVVCFLKEGLFNTGASVERAEFLRRLYVLATSRKKCTWKKAIGAPLDYSRVML